MPDKSFKTHVELVTELSKNPEFVRESRRQEPYYSVARQVYRLRKELNLTQEQLARQASTYQSRVSKIESAEFDMTLSTLIKIAEALDAHLEINLVQNTDWTDEQYQTLIMQPVPRGTLETYTQVSEPSTVVVK